MRFRIKLKKSFKSIIKIATKVAKVVAPITGLACYSGFAVACIPSMAATAINIASDCTSGNNKKCGMSVAITAGAYKA